MMQSALVDFAKNSNNTLSIIIIIIISHTHTHIHTHTHLDFKQARTGCFNKLRESCRNLLGR